MVSGESSMVFGHQGGHVRPLHRAGPRRWALLPAVVLVLALSGLAAGCSSTPTYCTDASQLKTSVQNLGSVDVATKGQPPATAAAAVASSVTQVKNSASNPQNAVPGNCH